MRSVKILHFLKEVLIYFTDFATVCRYGIGAPKYRELIFIEPSSVQACFPPGDVKELKRPPLPTAVYQVDRGVRVAPIVEAGSGTIGITARKVSERISWEEAGEFDRMRSKGMQINPSRYSLLDEIIAEVERFGELKSQKQRGLGNRETEGILVRIGANSQIILVSGRHRFGIAIGLNLPVVPVGIDGVDPKAMRDGSWKQIRKKSREIQGSPDAS